jgi:hypothetical protein
MRVLAVIVAFLLAVLPTGLCVCHFVPHPGTAADEGSEGRPLDDGHEHAPGCPAAKAASLARAVPVPTGDPGDHPAVLVPFASGPTLVHVTRVGPIDDTTTFPPRAPLYLYHCALLI